MSVGTTLAQSTLTNNTLNRIELNLFEKIEAVANAVGEVAHRLR
jgi:hypothetical protein